MLEKYVIVIYEVERKISLNGGFMEEIEDAPSTEQRAKGPTSWPLKLTVP